MSAICIPNLLLLFSLTMHTYTRTAATLHNAAVPLLWTGSRWMCRMHLTGVFNKVAMIALLIATGSLIEMSCQSEYHVIIWIHVCWDQSSSRFILHPNGLVIHVALAQPDLDVYELENYTSRCWLSTIMQDFLVAFWTQINFGIANYWSWPEILMQADQGGWLLVLDYAKG